MRISRSSGGARLDLDPDEARLLGAFFDDLAVILDPDSSRALAASLPPGAAEAVLDRLFPAAYRDDAQASAAFAEMTRSALLAERMSRLAHCRAELTTATAARTGLRGRHLRLDLDAESTQRWLRVLNDARLALGTLLGVSEEDDWPLEDAEPTDPLAQQRARYVWVTAVQDALVRAVMGD